MYVGVPRRITLVVPYTLQVVGSQELAVAGDSQISAIVEVQLLQEASLWSVQVLQLIIVVDKLVCGKSVLGIKVERHTSCVGLEIGNMVTLYACKTLFACILNASHHLLTKVKHRYTRSASLGIGSKVSTSSHIHNHLLSTEYLDTLIGRTYMTTSNRHHTHRCLICHGF